MGLDVLGRCASVGLAKVTLLVINTASFAVAAGMVGVGAKKASGTFRQFVTADGGTEVLLDPFVTLICLGSVLMPLSLTGAWAAIRSNKKLLFFYFWAVLLFATGLIYLAILCSVAADSNNSMSQLVSQYWSVVQEGLKVEANLVDTSGAQAAAAQASRLLDSAAGLGAAAAVLLFVSMFCASTITGHDWMLARVGITMNLMCCIVAAAVLYLSTVVSTNGIGGDWAPKMLGGMGIAILVESVGGVLALWLRWRILLWLHCVVVTLLLILTFSGCVACLVMGTDKISEVAAGSSNAILQNVLGCSARAANATAGATNATGFAVPAPKGANATLTTQDAIDVLACAMGGRAQQHFSQTNMLYIGALAVMLVVFLLFNFLASWYLLWLNRKERAKRYAQLKEAELAQGMGGAGAAAQGGKSAGDLEAAGGGALAPAGTGGAAGDTALSRQR